MAYEPVAPRYAQPPPALTNMGSNNRASFLSYMSEMSASAASAASASSLSAALAASSTADAENYSTESSSESQSQTRVTLSNPVPQTTASNPKASQTDSSGSSITSPATQSSQRSAFATSVATNSAASEHGPHYPDSSLQTADKGYHSGPSSGKIAAAVVIPLVFLLALGFGLFYLRRRRRRRAAALAGQPYHHHHPMTDRSPFSKEAALAKPAPRHPNSNGAPAPILTSATNNTYYTGLSTPTTPSRASTQTRGRSNDSTRPGAQTASIYDIPPPAYARDAPPGSTPTLPQLSFATDPFMDPVSPISTSDHTSATSPTGAALAALSGRDTAFTATSLSPAQHSVPRPNISRAGTMRSVTSVTSDMYSDTASVRSARPERFSGATAQVVVGSAGNANRLSGGSFAPGSIVRDPFGDPK